MDTNTIDAVVRFPLVGGEHYTLIDASVGILAARAADLIMPLAHGEFARLNFGDSNGN